ncbi:Piwi domain-containing protein [Acinetobacter baumannii]|uniref:Piwi domain-containing protein n=1 Tax=Acinetobacter baumannii TaxID=470 RepID=UPI003D05E8F7
MDIEINFFELEKQNFDLNLFVREVSDKDEKKLTVENSRLVNLSISDQKKLYEVVMEKHNNFVEKTISSLESPYLTLWYISQLIRLTSFYDRYEKFEKNKLKFFIKTNSNIAGDQEITIQPEYIEVDNKIGFLIDFNFNKSDSCIDYKQVQKLSFSLTLDGKVNGFKNKNIREFIEKNFKTYIDKILEKIDIKVVRKWYVKKYSLLNKCFYSNGQVELLSNIDLIRKYPEKIKFADNKNFYFLFDERNIFFARNVYKALTGALFKNYFSGMKGFFNMNVGKENVKKYELKGNLLGNLEDIEQEILKKDKNAFLVICLHGRDEHISSQFYTAIKLLCLKYDAGSQFLYSDKLSNENTLKYSISNVALQIFCKANGIPWSVTNRSDEKESLIIGIGTSHKRLNEEKTIFHAFAMCTDSSGIFSSSMTLAHSEIKNNYFTDIEKNLIELKKSSNLDNYKQVVFHLTNKISNSDMRVLSEIIKNIFNDRADLVILKLNKSSKYIGFSDRNDCVVAKGVCIKLHARKFLVWTDGHCNENIYSNRPSKPIDIEILHSPKDIIVKNLLEDIFKLSSANWHGFKTNSLPITLVYSKDIANFIYYVHESGLLKKLQELPTSKVSSPWFL